MSVSFDTDRTDVLGERIVAQILDNIALYVIAAAIAVPLMAGLMASGGEPIFAGVLVALVWGAPIGQFLLRLPYNVLFETVWDGQTPGKRVLDLRVVDETGAPPALWQVVVRNIPSIALFGPLQAIVAIVAIAVSDDHQRLFDVAATTYVIE
ncbi:MAG: RDD family protein [Halococcoides sp.]